MEEKGNISYLLGNLRLFKTAYKSLLTFYYARAVALRNAFKKTKVA
jgi:hypothetical protein